jgi:hypothetical protein
MHATAQECAEELIKEYGIDEALKQAMKYHHMYRGQSQGYWDEYYQKVIDIIQAKKTQ